MMLYKVTAVTAVLLSILMLGAALAVDPDTVRDRAVRPLTVQAEPLPPPSREQQAAALSDAFKKFSSSHMLMWKLSVSGNLMIMGQFTSARHCAEARKLLRRQVVRLGWGRAECLEVMLP